MRPLTRKREPIPHNLCHPPLAPRAPFPLRWLYDPALEPNDGPDAPWQWGASFSLISASNALNSASKQPQTCLIGGQVLRVNEPK